MAFFALFSWLPLALVLFARLPSVQGIIWVVLLPYLYLPERFKINLPGLPDLDKTAMISIGLVLAMVVHGQKLRAELGDTRPRMDDARLLKVSLWGCAAALLIGLFATVMNNREALQFGPTWLPAARPWDALSDIVKWVLAFLPFFFATKYLSSPKAHRILLTALTLAALGYSVLILVELRFSPQLHRWIYGYHQHSFAQHIRSGYRPMVFLQHGLWVGFFIFMALISSAAMWKITQESKWRLRTIWIFLILLLSQNVGALMIGAVMLAVFFWFSSRGQKWFIAIVSVSVLFFPALRQSQVVPSDQIVATIEAVSPARAQSLEFRLDNEDQLLDRVWEKKWTGWGGWARDRVYNERGRDLTVSEGRWIQTLGQQGWIGYLGLFGLLILPLITLALSRRIQNIPLETMALALIASGNLIYMIPNSTMTPIGLMVFGAVAGFVLYGADEKTETDEAETHQKRRATRYTRFGPREGVGRQGASRVTPRG